MSLVPGRMWRTVSSASSIRRLPGGMMGWSGGCRSFLSDDACRVFLTVLRRNAAGRDAYPDEVLAQMSDACWDAALLADRELLLAHLNSLIELLGVRNPEDPGFIKPLQFHGQLHMTWPDLPVPNPARGLSGPVRPGGDAELR